MAGAVLMGSNPLVPDDGVGRLEEEIYKDGDGDAGGFSPNPD